MIVPTADYRRTSRNDPQPLHRGLDAASYGVVGMWKRRGGHADRLGELASRIHDKASTVTHMADGMLRDRLAELRDEFRGQARRRAVVIPEALALMVEAAERTLGLRPYPVQVQGALSLDDGFLTEMATGEGKTLTACLTTTLAAWTGRPVHLVTVNDYLSDRDATEMGPFYTYCGVTVGAVTAPMSPEERYENYQKGIVYITSKELVADFLRDRLRLGTLDHPTRRLMRKMRTGEPFGVDGMVMRGLDTAIVDEADSVLIDEAVTPLIISKAQQNTMLVDACNAARDIAASLQPGVDFRTDLRYREVRLTDDGERKVEEASKRLPGVWQGPLRREELVQQALTARELYIRGKQYVVEDDKVTIVDEFTGRLMPNRTWRAGLHQAVEAKEGLEVTSPTETLARLSFQRFFRFFRRMAGMTGTAHEARAEFWHIYGLPVLRIPTHRPCIREQYRDRVFADRTSKSEAIVEDILRWHKIGRPVLVGTRNVQASESLAAMLSALGVEFDLLNATRHQEEARIVAGAGQMNRVTIATNMAGRGTDIKLGRGVVELGGLHVIASERHESGRIDRQLFGRSARQGDPGSAQAFMSMDDELVERFTPGWIRRQLVPAIEGGRPGAEGLARAAIARAQRSAERMAFRQRRSVLETDDRLERSLGFSGGT